MRPLDSDSDSEELPSSPPSSSLAPSLHAWLVEDSDRQSVLALLADSLLLCDPSTVSFFGLDEVDSELVVEDLFSSSCDGLRQNAWFEIGSTPVPRRVSHDQPWRRNHGKRTVDNQSWYVLPIA